MALDAKKKKKIISRNNDASILQFCCCVEPTDWAGITVDQSAEASSWPTNPARGPPNM